MGLRRQIQRGAMLVAFIAVVGYALPALYLTIVGLRTGAEELAYQKALNTATHLQQRIAEGMPIDTAYLTHTLNGDDAITVEVYDQVFSYGIPSSGAISKTANVGAVAVTISTSSAELQSAIKRQLLTTAFYAIFAAIAAWLVARQIAIRFERPIRNLVDTANRIGAGDMRSANQRYGVVELDNVAEVLDNVSSRIQELLLIERQLTSEISHQLRTPLTALQLQIDEILESADDPNQVRVEAERASRQVNRVTQAMQDLVSARRGQQSNTVTEISSSIYPVLSDIRSTVQKANRNLAVDVPAGLQTSAAAGAVRHILAILLENALQHGTGTISVTAANAAEWHVLRVADEGPGIPTETGQLIENLQRQLTASKIQDRHIGMSLAVALAVGVGGRLEWRPTEPNAVRIYLPVADSISE